MNYVQMIEPRLTAYRPSSPIGTGEVLVDWLRDLEQETVARLDLMSELELEFRPHRAANNADVTVWHLGRWFDVLASRVLRGAAERDERWHRDGWASATGYDPSGIGFLGLGTLTGYTTEEMLAVPVFGAEVLGAYLRGAIADIIEVIGDLSGEALHELDASGLPSPYQAVGTTIQGSFGHLGEIDALVSLHHRLEHDAGRSEEAGLGIS